VQSRYSRNINKQDEKHTLFSLLSVQVLHKKVGFCPMTHKSALTP